MDCPHIPLTPYSDFSQRLHQKVVGNRIPLVGSMEVTERCNLGCAHCYINIPAGDQGAHKRELKKAEIFGILDQIVDQGCLWLLLTGGEPFVRPDFLDIYTYAKKKGLLVTLFTNGTTISTRIADHLHNGPLPKLRPAPGHLPGGLVRFSTPGAQAKMDSSGQMSDLRVERFVRSVSWLVTDGIWRPANPGRLPLPDRSPAGRCLWF